MNIIDCGNGVFMTDNSVRECRKTNPNKLESNSTVYSDRLWRWNPELFSSLVKKHFKDCGQYFDNRSEKDIQSFLREYLSKPELILVRVGKEENASSGFPYWRFDYLA